MHTASTISPHSVVVSVTAVSDRLTDRSFSLLKNINNCTECLCIC